MYVYMYMYMCIYRYVCMYVSMYVSLHISIYGNPLLTHTSRYFNTIYYIDLCQLVTCLFSCLDMYTHGGNSSVFVKYSIRYYGVFQKVYTGVILEGVLTGVPQAMGYSIRFLQGIQGVILEGIDMNSLRFVERVFCKVFGEYIYIRQLPSRIHCFRVLESQMLHTDSVVCIGDEGDKQHVFSLQHRNRRECERSNTREFDLIV